MADDIYAWRPANVEPTVESQPAPAGSDVYAWRPANVEQPLSAQEYAQRSAAAGIAAGRPVEEQKKILQQRGFSPQAVEGLRQQYELGAAREQERQAGFGAKDWWSQAKRTGLGFADLFDAQGTTEYGRAKKRFEAGTPEAGDAQKIARYEHMAASQTGGTLFGSRDAADIANQVLGIPKIAQEAMIGGAVLKAAGVGAGAAAEASLAQRAGSALAAAPATLAVMPSMWREQARQRNLDNGRDGSDIQGYGPALINGLANVIVLNRLQSGVKSQTLGGAMKKGALFVGEQALVDLGLTDADALVKGVNEDFGKHFKMSTGYGTIENLLTGKVGEAMKQATGQFLLGATFAGLHSAGAFGDVMEGAKKDLDAAKEKGLTPDEAGAALADQWKTFQGALAEFPSLTRAQAESILKAKGQPPGEFMVSVMHNLPRAVANREWNALRSEFDNETLQNIRNQRAATSQMRGSAEPVKPRVMSADWTRPELEGISIAEVRSMADAAGVKSGGTRAEVIDRLMASEAAKPGGREVSVEMLSPKIAGISFGRPGASGEEVSFPKALQPGTLKLFRELESTVTDLHAKGVAIQFQAEPRRAKLYERILRKAGYVQTGEPTASHTVNGVEVLEYRYLPSKAPGARALGEAVPPTETPSGPEIGPPERSGASEKPTLGGKGITFGQGEVLSAAHPMNPAERHAFDKYGNAARLSVLDAAGKEIGKATISESGKTLHVPWLGASGLAGGEGRGAHPFGPREVKALARQLANAFPDAEVMSYTPSGGRIRAGETRHVDLVKLREAAAPERIAAIYERAATASKEDMANVRARVEAMSPAEVQKVAGEIGMVGKVTKADVLARIEGRRDAAIRRGLVGKPTPTEAGNASDIGLPERPGRAGVSPDARSDRAGQVAPEEQGALPRDVAEAIKAGTPAGGVSQRTPAAPPGTEAQKAELQGAAQETFDSLSKAEQKIVMTDPFFRDVFRAGGLELAEPRKPLGEKAPPTAADQSAADMLAAKIAGNRPQEKVSFGAKAADFPESPEGASTAEHIKESAQRFVQTVQDFTGRMAGQTAPKTNRLSEPSADQVARVGAAKQYARALVPQVLDEILPNDPRPSSRRLVGAVLIEQRLRHMREYFLSRGETDKAAAVGTIIGGKTADAFESNPLESEKSYQEALRDPMVQEAIGKYKERYVPTKEGYFRKAEGLAEEDAISGPTQIPGLPVYLKALREGETPSGSTVIFGGARGNLTGQRARKLGQARSATGAATNGYEIDLGKIIEADLQSLVPLGAKAELYRTLNEEGLGHWAKPGSDAPAEGWRKIPDVRPPKGTQEAGKGEIDLWVHPESYSEVRQVLGVDEPPSAVPFASALAKATLASTVEAAYHTRNLLSLITRPGMNPIEFMRNVRRVVTGDKEVMRRIAELTEIGAMKEHGFESATPQGGYVGGKLNPANWLAAGMEFSSKMMTVVDRAMRLTADHAFDVISKRPNVDASEGARRDFINQLGNYNKLTQPKFVAWLRDTGIGPFATAGTNFYMQGLRGLVGSHGFRTSSRAADLALRGETLLRMAVLPAVAAGINMMVWGRPDGDDKTPIAGLKVGDSNGKTSYLDLGGLVGVTRGMRETGLLALAEQQREGAQRKGAKLGDAADRAMGDIMTSALHPAAGPPVAFLHTLATGENMLGGKVAPQANLKKGESQSALNAYAALFQINPVLESWVRPWLSEQADIKEKKHEPTKVERAFKMLGPFGVKTRSQEPGAPHRTITIPLGSTGNRR